MIRIEAFGSAAVQSVMRNSQGRARLRRGGSPRNALGWTRVRDVRGFLDRSRRCARCVSDGEMSAFDRIGKKPVHIVVYKEEFQQSLCESAHRHFLSSTCTHSRFVHSRLTFPTFPCPPACAVRKRAFIGVCPSRPLARAAREPDLICIRGDQARPSMLQIPKRDNARGHSSFLFVHSPLSTCLHAWYTDAAVPRMMT